MVCWEGDFVCKNVLVVVAKDSVDTSWEISNCTDITLKKKEVFGNGVLNGWNRSRNEVGKSK